MIPCQGLVLRSSHTGPSRVPQGHQVPSASGPSSEVSLSSPLLPPNFMLQISAQAPLSHSIRPSIPFSQQPCFFSTSFGSFCRVSFCGNSLWFASTLLPLGAGNILSFAYMCFLGTFLVSPTQWTLSCVIISSSPYSQKDAGFPEIPQLISDKVTIVPSLFRFNTNCVNMYNRALISGSEVKYKGSTLPECPRMSHTHPCTAVVTWELASHSTGYSEYEPLRVIFSSHFHHFYDIYSFKY